MTPDNTHVCSPKTHAAIPQQQSSKEQSLGWQSRICTWILSLSYVALGSFSSHASLHAWTGKCVCAMEHLRSRNMKTITWTGQRATVELTIYIRLCLYFHSGGQAPTGFMHNHAPASSIYSQKILADNHVVIWLEMSQLLGSPTCRLYLLLDKEV